MAESVISMDEKKQVIIDFLEKCNQYSDEMLLKYQQEIAETVEVDEKQLIEKKLGQWTSYREFNIHAIGELNSEKLDDWF